LPEGYGLCLTRFGLSSPPKSKMSSEPVKVRRILLSAIVRLLPVITWIHCLRLTWLRRALCQQLYFARLRLQIHLFEPFQDRPIFGIRARSGAMLRETAGTPG